MFRIPITELEEKSFKLRRQLIDLLYQTKSGHLDTSLSLVEVYLSIVYSDSFKFDPKDGTLPDRDVVFLSEGHACPIQYLINADLGYYDVDEVFQGMRKPFTPFQGHTQRNLKYGFENSNGSLGIGLWQAYGYAKESPGNVFCIAGDGEFQEPISFGIIQAPLILELPKNYHLIVNNNSLAQDSYLELGPLGEVAKMYGWNVKYVDGHSFADLGSVLKECVDSTTGSLIICKTVKGKGGAAEFEGKLGMHGRPPKNEEEYKTYIEGLESSKRS